LTGVKWRDKKMAMSPKTFTTAEAAIEVGISRATLQEWIRQGKISPPKPTLRGAVGMRLWTQSDVARLGRVKQTIYRKGRGRKKAKA
jgi:excisionase family DNA binding protein